MSELATVLTSLAGGAFIGFAGTAFVQMRQERAARKAERDLAIDAASAAADDLLNSVQLFRNVWAPRLYRAIINGAAKVVTGSETPAADDLKSAVIQSFVQATRQAMIAVSAEGIVSRVMDTSGARYLEVVVGPRQRLSAAVAVLRRSPDAQLAEAADDLVTSWPKILGVARTEKKHPTSAQGAIDFEDEE